MMESLYGGPCRAAGEPTPSTRAPPRPAIFMGAPAYHDHAVPFLDDSESVAKARGGARLGLSSHGARDRFGLPGAYVDFAATEEDWKEYTDHWMVN
ncbi:hypothetical protein [Nonomuraea dietziae]|uniref:hypothetical protein n=1 Tax=Nonomuraea dietziae TaxID=65515 RepID=UPI0031D2922E